MNVERTPNDWGFQDQPTWEPPEPLSESWESEKEPPSIPKTDRNSIPVRLVPAEELGPNFQNPYDRLLPQERYARFVSLLARIYRSANREDAGEKGARPAA